MDSEASKKASLKDELKQTFYLHLEDSTIHGLAHIIKSGNYILLVIWLICFLGCVTGCIIFIVDCFTAYYSYGVVVTISRVQELPAPFPAITICNVNAYNEKNSLNYMVSKLSVAECFRNHTDNLTSCLQNYIPENFVYNNYLIYLDLMKTIIAADNLTDADREALGYSLDNDMLVSLIRSGI